jgi:hypothetical protein
LAVQYKTPGGSQFLWLPALTAVENLELFLQVPERQSLYSKRERERERGQPERSTIAKAWSGGFPGGQTSSECQGIMATA